MSFNFAPPGQEEAAATPAPAEDAPSGPLTAAQRLAALKAKLAVARKTNHKAVVEEDRREKLGPEGLRDESKQKSYERQKKEGKVETDTSKIMSTTAAVAQDKQDKLDKKARRRGEYGWDVFNNEAQYRHFKKRVRRAEEDGRLGGEEGSTIDNRSCQACLSLLGPPGAPESVRTHQKTTEILRSFPRQMNNKSTNRQRPR